MRLSFFVRCLITIALASFLALPAKAADIKDPENTLLLDLKFGRVTIEMMPNVAPQHVKRIKDLVRQKFYDGHKFHRVIDGFMAQTGDPTGTGRGGSGKKLRAEFSNIPHTRGIVSMARARNRNSADSQFFIVLEDSNHLDGKYTVWGKVLEGMEFVDMIRKGYGQGGTVRNPDIIVSLRVAADVQ